MILDETNYPFMDIIRREILNKNRKVFMKFLTFAIIASSLTFTAGITAQSSTSMQDILETVTKKVVELEEQRNQEVVNMTLDLLVNQGKKSMWRNLDPSFDYDVIVIGDRRISKLRITVHKKDSQTNEWKLVDEYSAEKPQLRIDPMEFEQYEFTVTVDEFKTGESTGHFALILYHQNPEKNR